MIAFALGGADTLWDDLKAASALVEPDLVVACNDALVHYPGPLAAACSLHHEKMERWLKDRVASGFNVPDRVFARIGGAPFEETDYMLPGQLRTGSSGLFAVKVALIDLGAAKVICCGIPMDKRPHFFSGANWQASQIHKTGWVQALPEIEDRVKSMSGWTRKLLGEPTKEWLNDDSEH